MSPALAEKINASQTPQELLTVLETELNRVLAALEGFKRQVDASVECFVLADEYSEVVAAIRAGKMVKICPTIYGREELAPSDEVSGNYQKIRIMKI